MVQIGETIWQYTESYEDEKEGYYNTIIECKNCRAHFNVLVRKQLPTLKANIICPNWECEYSNE